jgi:GTPase
LINANESALNVKDGCATPVPPASTLRVSKREHDLSPASYVEGILKGDRAVLARAITLIESTRAIDRQIADDVLDRCLPASGKSIRVGVTGIPGAGKSCLIEALGKHLISERREKIAVLAVDPSSQFSGGSILGDKTRMTFLASSDMAFIRPSPSRGVHGGVAHNTRDAILLCEAAGYQNILVETVGVGQSEAAVGGMVDFLMLVTLAGAGDELQGIKRGLMEMADAVVVNKTDGDNIGSSERACSEVARALHFFPAPSSGWIPRALCCSALNGRGVAGLWSCVLEYAAITKASGWFERTRREQALRAMHDHIESGLLQIFRSNPVVQERLPDLEQKVLAGSMTTASAVRELLVNFASK